MNEERHRFFRLYVAQRLAKWLDIPVGYSSHAYIVNDPGDAAVRIWNADGNMVLSVAITHDEIECWAWPERLTVELNDPTVFEQVGLWLVKWGFADKSVVLRKLDTI